ncbi:MAG TPA: alpha/beta fold hydrolase [Polyangiaceae bacterium]
MKSAAVSENPETLLFLPGTGGRSEIWQPVADGLSHPGRRRLFGWPGFGGMPADPSVRGIADLVTRVVESIAGPTLLFAQSMGGVIAMRAALEQPHEVRGLVLAVTSGGIDTRALGASDWRPAFRKANPNLPTWFLDEREDLSARLAEIRIPVLLLYGDADPISPVRVGERLAELLPRAELVVFEGGTHELVSERASEVIELVERYLRGLES